MRLQSLQSRQEQINSQIINYEKLANECTQDIKIEQNGAKILQLEQQRDRYWQRIDELYKKLDSIGKQINNLDNSNSQSGSNDDQYNHKNQQELKIDDSLHYIDFKKPLKIFNQIQSQFSKEGDVALFFIEEHFIKRGDLCLQRLRDELTPDTPKFYRQHFRHCPVKFSSGNLDSVLEGIATFYEVEQEEISIKSVINKIGKSLHTNSVLFIEIECDINDANDIETLIPWFINEFWQPLRIKINEVIKNFDGIKVVAIIVSDLLLNPRFSTKDLSRYCCVPKNCFERNKLIQIPLENWTKDDIYNWLGDCCNPSLKINEKNEIAKKIYQQTQGLPTAVCFALQQKWHTLTNLPHSC